MEYKALAFKADAVDLDERTFTGYASTWTRDQGGDTIHKGAYAKTLRERGDRIKVLWQHRDPLGKPVRMAEDDFGLKVTGRISKTRLGDEALELMRDGVVDQMSIGYSIPQGKSTYDEATGFRDIFEVKLLEFSPVTFPMNEAAIITGVKSLQEAMAHQKHFSEHELRQLANAVDGLNALIKGEPSADTRAENQPQDLTALASAINQWGI